MLFVGLSLPTLVAIAQDIDDTSSVTLKPSAGNTDVPTGDATETDEEPPKSQEHFSVSTYKIGGKKTEKSSPIQLVLPQHNSRFTPGVITFSWKLAPTMKKKKVLFVLEKTDTKKRATQYWKGDKLSIELKAGTYRWQVSSATPKAESHWRYFAIVDNKSKSVPKMVDSFSPSSRIANRAKPLTTENAISKPSTPYVDPAPSQEAANEDSGSDDEKLAQIKTDKLKAEKEAKDLETQLEVAKQEHMNALKEAQEQASRLKAEKAAKLKAQKDMAIKLARAEAERKAKLKAEREARIKLEKMRARQLAEAQLEKQKAEKAAKKLQAKILAEKKAKAEAEEASRELALKVEAERQATARIKTMSQGMGAASGDDDDEEDTPAPPPQRRPTKRIVQNPGDQGPPAEPPALPSNNDQSGDGNSANSRPVPPRVPAQNPRGPANNDDSSSKRGEVDELKFQGE